MSSQTESAPSDPIQLTESDDINDIVTSYDVVLVDFYADWCGPCQMMEPTIESIATETDAAVLKIDVDRFQQLAAQHNVQGVPTLLVFADGEIVERLVGAQPEQQLFTTVQQHTA